MKTWNNSINLTKLVNTNHLKLNIFHITQDPNQGNLSTQVYIVQIKTDIVKIDLVSLVKLKMCGRHCMLNIKLIMVVRDNEGARPSIDELELPLSDIFFNHSNNSFELRKSFFFSFQQMSLKGSSSSSLEGLAPSFEWIFLKLNFLETKRQQLSNCYFTSCLVQNDIKLILA